MYLKDRASSCRMRSKPHRSSCNYLKASSSLRSKVLRLSKTKKQLASTRKQTLTNIGVRVTHKSRIVLPDKSVKVNHLDS